MFKLAVIFIFLFTNISFGQNDYKRSDLEVLKNNLRYSNNASSKISSQLKIGKYYLELRHGQNAIDNDSAGFYFSKSLMESRKMRPVNASLLLEAMCLSGELEFGRDHAEAGIKFFNMALSYRSNEPREQGLLLARAIRSMYVYISERRKARPYIERAIQIFRKTQDFNLAAEMAYYHTVISLNNDNVLTRKLCQSYLLEYQRYNSPWVGKYYFILSSMNRYEGNLDLALKYILTGIKWMNRTGDKERLDLYYGELGQVYEELGQTEKSIATYRKAIAIRDTLYIKQIYLIRTIGFVADGLINLKRPKEAIEEILSFEKRHTADGRNEELWIAQIKAKCYNALGFVKHAEKYHLKVISLYKNGANEVNTFAQYDIAKFYVQHKDYDKAKNHIKQILYPTISASHKRNFYLLLHQIDSADGNFASALANFKKYKAINDSLFNTAKIHEIEKLQVQFETNQKEQDIRLLKQEKLIQSGSLRREKTIRNLTITGILILVVFTFILYRNYRKNVANNLEISSKNEALNQLVIEKQWLVKEIHHRVKNNLQIVTGLLHSQSLFIKDKDALNIIKDSQHRMQSIALIHQKLYQTDDMVFIDIHTYIEELVNQLKESYNSDKINFKLDFQPIRLNVSHAVPLGIILNEAITNAIKYAYPSGFGTVSLSLRNENSVITLLISDSGIGFSEDWKLEKANSMGMNLMKGLSKQIGGSLTVKSIEGVSVQLTFSV